MCCVLYCTVLYCTVSRYGRAGWLEDLPSLNVGRSNHGCGSYVSAGGDLVSADKIMLPCHVIMTGAAGDWRLPLHRHHGAAGPGVRLLAPG